MIKLYPVLIALLAIVSTSFTTGNKESVVTVKARSQSKIVLSWEAAGTAVSHYVVERSVNGRSFYEAGILFTDDQTKEDEYVFTDDLRMNYGGALYYRLRVVKTDKSQFLTAVTAISRMGGMNPLTH